jgi:hypothetical protein
MTGDIKRSYTQQVNFRFPNTRIIPQKKCYVRYDTSHASFLRFTTKIIDLSEEVTVLVFNLSATQDVAVTVPKVVLAWV